MCVCIYVRAFVQDVRAGGNDSKNKLYLSDISNHFNAIPGSDPQPGQQRTAEQSEELFPGDQEQRTDAPETELQRYEDDEGRRREPQALHREL